MELGALADDVEELDVEELDVEELLGLGDEPQAARTAGVTTPAAASRPARRKKARRDSTVGTAAGRSSDI